MIDCVLPILDFLGKNKDSFSSLSSIIGVIVVAAAYFQYRRSEQWKRVEYITGLYNDFINDSVNQKAMMMLNWRKRKVSFENSQGKLSVFSYSVTDIVSALDLSKNKYSALEVHIQETFDNFFSYLGDFERAIKSKLAKESEILPPLRYWINALNGANKIGGQDHLPAAAVSAIKAYAQETGHADALGLLKRT